MATYLKRRIAQEVTDEMERKVRETVQSILADVKKRGDAAVREYSERFDKWAPKKLSASEIKAILEAATHKVVSSSEYKNFLVNEYGIKSYPASSAEFSKLIDNGFVAMRNMINTYNIKY